jgi:hypothetical protein
MGNTRYTLLFVSQKRGLLAHLGAVDTLQMRHSFAGGRDGLAVTGCYRESMIQAGHHPGEDISVRQTFAKAIFA